VPRFAHVALLTGDEGKLSKRLGSLGCDAFREQGIEPQAIAALLARIGTSLPVEPVASLEALAETLDFSRFGRAPARFDMDELTGVNTRIVHQLAFDAVADRLPEGMDEAAWIAVRPNLGTVAEAADWWAVIRHGGATEPAEEDRAFLAAAAEQARRWSGGRTPGMRSRGAEGATGRKGGRCSIPCGGR
jgi:glutamyl-tRNA synthetase